jgi:hypothetical protein
MRVRLAAPTTKETIMTTDPHDTTGTPRPGNPGEPPTDPNTEGNPVTPPNPAEAPPTQDGPGQA